MKKLFTLINCAENNSIKTVFSSSFNSGVMLQFLAQLGMKLGSHPEAHSREPPTSMIGENRHFIETKIKKINVISAMLADKTSKKKV